MVVKEPDGAVFSRKKVIIWGCVVTVFLCMIILLFVPQKPKNIGTPEPLQTQSMFSTDVKSDLSPAQNYAKFCAACHGDKGNADTQMARMMSVKPSNLQVGPFKFERTQPAIRDLILYGSQVMPGFERELSREAADNLARYVLDMQKKPQ